LTRFNCALPIRPYPAKPAQDGRIYIELVNAAFLKAGGTAEQFRDGIKRAVGKGWMMRHESGTYVKFTTSLDFHGAG
jgi:hypothetical protein